jgi:N utilization substance protein A
MNIELIGAIKQISKERKIDEELIFNALKVALIAACKKIFPNQEIMVDIDQDSGVMVVYILKNVVPDDVKDINISREIKLSESWAYDLNSKVGDIIKIDSTPEDFGRIAAQTVKQLMSQKLLELGKNLMYGRFKEKIGKVVNAIVQNVDKKGNILLNLDGIETILTTREQISDEKFYAKDRIKVYITEIRQHSRGITILVSRTALNFVKALFEQEIPEINSGLVEIKAVSREPGKRSKIALLSKRDGIEAIGSCVGENNSRINIILKEINGEKIDLIDYDEDLLKYIKNSLSPARINRIILNDNKNCALVICDSNQISLVIGKSGQNVRLASKLVGVKLDVKTEEEAAKLLDQNT